MRVRVFFEVDVDDATLITSIQQHVPEAVAEQIPQYMANTIQGLAMQLIPGVVHVGACVIPPLEPKTHIIQPTGRLKL